MKLATAVVAAMALSVPAAVADSFTPVTLTTTLAPVARLHKPLKITVAVGADPGVLDNRFGPLQIEVRLASECGGTFQTTPGTTLLNKLLKPQPNAGEAYSAVARGSGRPSSYGVETACVYLEEQSDNRVWASDQSIQVNVSKSCTTAAKRYDKARKRHKRAVIKADRRRARRACGPGVPL